MATTNKAFKVKSGLIVEGGSLYPVAGTTTIAPIVFTSGTNLTTAAAGSFEFDGTRFYLSPSTTRKAIALTDSTGVTLDSTITGSSLTSVGTLANLTVTNTITGSVSGSAGSVANSITFNTSGGAAAGTTFNGGTARTIDYTTVGAAASSHSHGNITNAGAIGSTTGLIIKTGTSGVLEALAAGTTSQFLRGDATWQTVSVTDTTYSHAAVTTTGGAFLRLTSSSAVDDDVKFASGTNTTVAYTDANTITISSTDTNYYPTAVTMTAGTTSGPTVDLTMSGTSNITGSAIPSASATASGVITTGTQTIAGAKTFSGATVFGSTVTLNADPSSAMHAATKQYVDGVASGVNAHDAVQYATTATIAGTYTAGSAGADGGTGVGATITYTSTGTTTIDSGSTLALNDRVLVKDGVTADAGTGSKANGIYYVTTAGATGVATVLTRALDYDNSIAGDIMTGDLVYVVSGTSNGGIQFLMNVSGTATTPVKGIKIGTDAITFTQFSGATSTLAGAGLTATGNVFNVGAGTGITVATDAVAFDTTAALNTAITGVGTLASGTWNATVIAGQYGGTGVANTGKTITVSGNTTIGSSTNTVAFTTSGNTSVALPTTGTLATLAGAESLTNKKLGSLTSNGLVTTSGGDGTLSITTMGTGIATFLSTPSSANLISAITDETGSGALVFANTPTLVTPVLGVATATSINKVAITAPATSATLTIADGKTLTASNTLTFTGTDSSSVAFGSGGTVAYVASPAFTGTPTFGGNAGIVNASGSGSALFTLSSMFDKTVYNGGEFIVKLSDGTDFEIIKVLVVIKGTTFYVTQYGDVQSNSSLGTVDFTLSTNNVNMTITPVAGTVTAKVIGTLLAA